MSHVKGHPRDLFRDFLEHSVDEIDNIVGLLPSAAELPKKDKFGRVVARRVLPMTLGSTGIGLLALSTLQSEGATEEQVRRAKMVLKELDAQRAMEKNPEAGTGKVQK